MEDSQLVFLTGATGYIGGRLAPRLLERGHRLRCLTRSRQKLVARPWSAREGVEIAHGNAQDLEFMTDSMRGCRVAYYLIHSMIAAGEDYVQRDLELATTFAKAAEAAGVERIIYLGGLGESGDDLSKHLKSRREVELALDSTSVSLTVLRAAMILGSGSASFEILRYLVERLPIMITPRWVSTETQPIAIDNVLRYLVDCLEAPETEGLVLDIGGAEVLRYRDLMQIMADELDISKRIIVPVPILTPTLSSWWIHLVTPLSKEIARPLAEGLRNRVVAGDAKALELMPQELLTPRQAIRLSLGHIQAKVVETSWSDAGPIPGDPDWAGGTLFEDHRCRDIEAPPNEVFRAVCRIGGGNGWYAADFLWRIRGVMDQLVGGPGLRRGRRNPENVSFGDALDFWRVTGLEKDRRLSLRAEMKVPGIALLEFKITPIAGGSRLDQIARFKPAGLFGLAYWYAVLPLHGIVFSGMMAGIEREAKKILEDEESAVA